jgi:hypothetical protein
MRTVVSRIFLVLLLVAEWAGDPHFGQSAFSRPLSSQPVSCHSIGVNPLSPTHPTLPRESVAALVPECHTSTLLSAQSYVEHRCACSGEPDLTYLLMSMQR